MRHAVPRVYTGDARSVLVAEHKRMTARYVGRVTEVGTHAAVEVRRIRLQAELERIVRVLVEQYDPECVILYGSCEHGDIHE
jgi:hypothetical protein